MTNFKNLRYLSIGQSIDLCELFWEKAQTLMKPLQTVLCEFFETLPNERLEFLCIYLGKTEDVDTKASQKIHLSVLIGALRKRFVKTLKHLMIESNVINDITEKDVDEELEKKITTVLW